MAITFDVALFRDQFKAFADEASYSDAFLQSIFDVATCYVSDEDYGLLKGACRLRALNLMTAHLVALDELIAAGNSPGLVTSSSIGSVSVSLKPTPGDESQWEYWHNLTPYGQQLLSLLAVASASGFYVGGSPERAGFRKTYGLF